MPSLPIDRNTSGVGTAIIPAKTGFRIQVTSFFLNSAGTETVTFESGNGDDLSGPIVLAAAGRVEISNPSEGVLKESNLSEAVHLKCAAGSVQISGSVSFRYRPQYV